MPKELPVATFFDRARVILGQLDQYICEGPSMSPTLYDGEAVLVDRRAEIEVGDVVLARHPVEQVTDLVKRIDRINANGHYVLVGDNPDADSYDSRDFGAVTREYIKGKVVARLG